MSLGEKPFYFCYAAEDALFHGLPSYHFWPLFGKAGEGSRIHWLPSLPEIHAAHPRKENVNFQIGSLTSIILIGLRGNRPVKGVGATGKQKNYVTGQICGTLDVEVKNFLAHSRFVRSL